MEGEILSPATLSLASGQATNWEKISPEELKGYKHIQEGVGLVKGGRHKQAIDHFRKKEADGIGFTVSRGADRFLDKPPGSLEEAVSIANFAAFRSTCSIEPGKRISLSGIDTNYQYPANIHQVRLEREIALVHLEEWLHALQFYTGKSLMGYQDPEVDVAAFMVDQGIPLTPAFLLRYDRGSQLYQKEGVDDTLTARPAFRKGTFVRVPRSDGTVRENWQITKFDNQNGRVVVRDTRGIYEKSFKREELFAYNETGVYPFAQVTTILELFARLDQLGSVAGSKERYSAKALKRLINQVRGGRSPIEILPRSGGLRQTVEMLIGNQV
ncbi:MAG: hypothetical protein ABH867_02900 [Patescibacteria group bacterium]|nr:hypothetical protein [Patescibacteria group bacterium]